MDLCWECGVGSYYPVWFVWRQGELICDPHTSDQEDRLDKCVFLLKQCKKSITNYLVNVKFPICEAASELQLTAVHVGYIGSTDYDQILVDQFSDLFPLCASSDCKHPIHKWEQEPQHHIRYADVIRSLQDMEWYSVYCLRYVATSSSLWFVMALTCS